MMNKCKLHNMEMIETNDFGYTTHCKECGETYTFNSNDDSGAYKFMAVAVGIGAVIAIIMEIFNINI